ncbi:hypothetical protein Q428_11430 [Fervidicella metallireducens AeB]|uniref:Uncharacterized protein n=1 Tax=Fervidicella metallireducens AeB TaxID=1403537 RepID=A0A017RT67_9CLOT|nr:hypothetical protein [Fervidicella metallireducens]EYE87811.1 hypothetical protein Q428_11430 [Fervidicella metallireducens AeB]
MQQEWDDIDELIKNSFEDFKITSDYNERLRDKAKIKVNKVGKPIIGYSLITAGILLMFLYTSDIQLKIIDAQIKFRSEFATVENILKIDKIFLGE